MPEVLTGVLRRSQVQTLCGAGLDYEKFMANLLSYKTYSKELVDASEADATPFMKDTWACSAQEGHHPGASVRVK